MKLPEVENFDSPIENSVLSFYSIYVCNYMMLNIKIPEKLMTANNPGIQCLAEAIMPLTFCQATIKNCIHFWMLFSLFLTDPEESIICRNYRNMSFHVSGLDQPFCFEIAQAQ